MCGLRVMSYLVRGGRLLKHMASGICKLHKAAHGNARRTQRVGFDMVVDVWAIILLTSSTIGKCALCGDSSIWGRDFTFKLSSLVSAHSHGRPKSRMICAREWCRECNPRPASPGTYLIDIARETWN